MTTWVVASDFAGRIADLVEALKDIEPSALAERASVGTEQVRRWLRDEVKPRQKMLERWAKREGWPVNVFAEGGPMPSTVVNSLVNERPEKVMENGITYDADAGMDPIRTVQVMLAIDLMESAAKAADKLLNSNLLEPAERALWNGIEAAQRELRGEGLAAVEAQGKDEDVAGDTSG